MKEADEGRIRKGVRCGDGKPCIREAEEKGMRLYVFSHVRTVYTTRTYVPASPSLLLLLSKQHMERT